MAIPIGKLGIVIGACLIRSAISKEGGLSDAKNLISGSLKVIDDDGALLPCAINASCAALVDAGIPLKNLAVAIGCRLNEHGSVMLISDRGRIAVARQMVERFGFSKFGQVAIGGSVGNPVLDLMLWILSESIVYRHEKEAGLNKPKLECGS